MTRIITTFLIVVLVGGGLSSCQTSELMFQPEPIAFKHPKEIEKETRRVGRLPESFSVAPFNPLTESEKKEPWGLEFTIAQSFAEDFDLYRAITSFKRARFLLPEEKKERQLEIDYKVALAYYLGRKYVEVLHTIETTSLCVADCAFPAYQDLLVILYETYVQLENSACAELVLKRIQEELPVEGEKLSLYQAIRQANLVSLEQQSIKNPFVGRVMERFSNETKSPLAAKVLNGLLPGAGYWYLGQKQTAMTAFLVNSLFIGAATHFFLSGNLAAGLITTSLEGGWYFGGIYGAGLSAQEYNQKVYRGYADKIYQKEKCLPTMRLKYSF